MIGLDTNSLARYYVAGRPGAQAERQREAARRLIDSGQPLMVCKTVSWSSSGCFVATMAPMRSNRQRSQRRS